MLGWYTVSFLEHGLLVHVSFVEVGAILWDTCGAAAGLLGLASTCNICTGLAVSCDIVSDEAAMLVLSTACWKQSNLLIAAAPVGWVLPASRPGNRCCQQKKPAIPVPAIACVTPCELAEAFHMLFITSITVPCLLPES
jgi:hypothetical protein